MKWLFDRKDVYSTLNAEDAEQFVQEKYGYFADSLEELNTVINNRDNFKLACVEDYTYDKRFMYEEDGEKIHTSLFLPEDKILAVKTELRPIKTIEEWKETVGANIGQIIQIRAKGQDIRHVNLIVSGFSFVHGNQIEKVILGGFLYTPKTLFSECEFYKDGQWCRFGVEE